MQRLELLSTDHCTLCEQALDLLLSLPEIRGFALRVVDIAHQPDLFTTYAERIPVLRKNGDELCWPFSGEEVMAWLGD